MGDYVDFLKPMEQSSKSQETNLDAARVPRNGVPADVQICGPYLVLPHGC